MKKIICSALALLLAISPISTFAFTVKPVAPPGNTPVTLNTTPLTFNATVPTGLPLDLAANGVVTPATEASIINGSIGPIKVVSITTEAAEYWTLTNYTDDFSAKKVNSKDIALQLNQDNVQSSGSITLTPQNWPAIEGNGSLRLDYQGKLASQSTDFVDATAAHVSFVLDWDSSISTPEAPEAPVDKYVMATDEDFSGTTNGTFKYIGTNKYVEVPHVIKGIPVTSYYSMFAGTSIEGVKSNNTNVTDMRGMFSSSKATTLDLSNFDTSNVTDMGNMFFNSKSTILDLSNFDTSNVNDMTSMFAYSQATTLDVSSFNTSKAISMQAMFMNSQATTLNLSNLDTSSVNNMGDMFNASKATTLDLSSFNTANVRDMFRMFANSNATTGYARTQTDADKFNTSNTSKPSALTFVVKSDTPDLTVGTKYTEGNYEYSYGEWYFAEDNEWIPSGNSLGWGVRVVDTVQTEYNQPLKMIQGEPVVDYSFLFYNTNNQDLTLIGDWDTSNVTTMNFMFYNNGATNINGLNKLDTSNVTSMWQMFCRSNATTLDLSSFDTSKVTNMSGMFNSIKATTLDVSNFDTSKVTNMKNMFDYSSLTTLDLSNFDTTNVTNMSHMFRGSDILNITGLTNFNTSNVTDMSNMFNETKMTTLDLRSFDTSNVTNTSQMFSSSLATTGYARTQTDANTFNTSEGKPEVLTFAVK